VREDSTTESAGAEFWRDSSQLSRPFVPAPHPEAYISNAPTDDERFYAPLSETVGTRPLWISPSQSHYQQAGIGAGYIERLFR
jgi:2,4'-dihydroxyacetophenone dioxygenase